MQRRDVVTFSVMFALGLLLYWPIFSIRPLGGDNLYALAWVHSASVSDLVRGDPQIYPEWRPLAYLFVWLEYRAFGVAQLPLFYLVNLAGWAACACLVSRIVWELTGRPIAAVVAGLIPFVDRRAHETLTWIIEAQTILASLFGLVALWLMVRAKSRVLTASERVAMTALLLAAMLSKEYGAAFAIAVAIYGLVSRRRELSIIAAGSLGIYVTLRWAVAGGAAAIYCQDMGFGFSIERQCLDPLTVSGLPQMIYNAAAGAIASVLAGVFDPAGAIAPTPYRIAISMVLLALACYGLRKAPVVVLLPALLPLTVGLLSYTSYGPRNVLIGLDGLAIVAGVGLAKLDRHVRLSPLDWRAIAVAVILALGLGRRAFDAHQFVLGTSALLNSEEPCASSVRQRAFGARFAPIVKRSFELPDPDCAASY